MTRSRKGLIRRSFFGGVLGVIVIAIAWGVIGAIYQPRMLAEYREDYESAKFADKHPTLVRWLKDEEKVRAMEVFSRDYEELEHAGYFMAPIRVVTVKFSHDKYQELVDPTERQKFEKERIEREEKQKKEDEERRREIEAEEREEKRE